MNAKLGVLFTGRGRSFFYGKNKRMATSLDTLQGKLERLATEALQLEFDYCEMLLQEPSSTADGVWYAMKRRRELGAKLQKSPEQLAPLTKWGRQRLHLLRALDELKQATPQGRWHIYFDQYIARMRRQLRAGRLTLENIGLSEKKLRALRRRNGLRRAKDDLMRLRDPADVPRNVRWRVVAGFFRLIREFKLTNRELGTTKDEMMGFEAIRAAGPKKK